MAYYNHNLELMDYNEASASSNPINLKLIFSDEVASPVFTTEKIIGAKKGGNGSIQVILINANTGIKVTTGTVAFAKVKIVLVGGNYDGTTNFEDNIVAVWGKKKNLLRSNVYVDLKHGSGTVGEIRIKHDRNHFKKVEFRLGAMVVDSDHYQVKPAVTQPFEVKDQRTTPKFLRSLSPTDKVWRLINIGKNGPIRKRLEDKNVFTVNDFLSMYYINRHALQEVYGSRGIKWYMTVHHAKTCNAGNIPRRLGSTSKGTNTMPSFDDGGSSEFDNHCYIPQHCENDLYGENMIEDPNYSTDDLEKCDMVVCLEASRQDVVCVASTSVGYGGEAMGIKAKKRWMKMKALWFSIVSFRCGCAT